MLANAAGQPIADAVIEVFSRNATTTEHLAGVVTTDALGRYSYEVLANSSRTLRFVYRGTALYLPTEGEVTVLVRAASTIRAKPRRLVNGQVVRFTGNVQSLPAPPAELVELQVVPVRALADVSYDPHRAGRVVGSALSLQTQLRRSPLPVPRTTACRGGLRLRKWSHPSRPGPRPGKALPVSTSTDLIRPDHPKCNAPPARSLRDSRLPPGLPQNMAYGWEGL